MLSDFCPVVLRQRKRGRERLIFSSPKLGLGPELIKPLGFYSTLLTLSFALFSPCWALPAYLLCSLPASQGS